MVKIIRGLSSGNGIHSADTNPWYIYSLSKLRQTQQNEMKDLYDKLKGGQGKKPKTDVTLN